MNSNHTAAQEIANAVGMTAADIEAFAGLLRPTFDLVMDAGESSESALGAAAFHAQRGNDDEYARRMIHLDDFVGALAGTWDEFRAEAGMASS